MTTMIHDLAVKVSASKAKTAKKKVVKVNVVSGPRDFALYINGYRVAGGKPWGGGVIVQEWTVNLADLEKALKEKP